MGRLEGRRHWLVFAALLVTTLLTVGIGVVGVGLALVILLETGSLVAGLSTLVPYVAGVVVLGLLDAVLLVWTVVAALRRLSLPRDDRLAAAAERAEALPGLRSLELAERFEPTDEQRRAELRRQYVDGEITEAEFERRVREHVEDPSDLTTEDPTLARVLGDDTETADERADGERARAHEETTGEQDRGREPEWAVDDGETT